MGKAGTSATLYQYDQGGHLLEESDAQGNALVDYIYLGALPVATISPREGQVYFLHDDRLGTPKSATDINQTLLWFANYGPFGEVGGTPGLIVQDLRLPGQEYDAETALNHNGFRDYMPGWGRYLQSDPIGLVGGLNTYGYAGSNPAGAVDPSGLSAGPAGPQSDNRICPSWAPCATTAGVSKVTTLVHGPFNAFAKIAIAISQFRPFTTVAALPAAFSYLNLDANLEI